MKGILFGALAGIAALVGGTIYVVFAEARASHQAAVDRCLAAGGGWLPSGARSYSGTCLRAPDARAGAPADLTPRRGPAP